MNTIAFDASNSLNQQQLTRLEKSKSPPSSLSVTNARRDPSDPRQLLVDLGGDDSGNVRSIPASVNLPKGMRRAVEESVWSRRPKDGAAAGVLTDATNTIRLLCIHGIGHGDVDANLPSRWTNTITAQLRAANPALTPVFEFLAYDDLFDQAPHNVLTYGEAFLRLGWSGLATTIGGWLGFRGNTTDSLRWTAGMVAQWAENQDLRRDTRVRVAEAVRRFAPDVVVAHSLGTLISYDTFSRVKDDSGKPWEGPELIDGRFYVSLGSQIGSPFTRQTLGGRIKPLKARHWFHLFNKHDNAFTAEIRLTAPNFDQIKTTFDIDGMLDHEAVEYLGHRAALDGCWRSLALAAPQPATRKISRTKGVQSAKFQTEAAAEHRLSVMRPILRQAPRRRALLVGINDYPNPADRLEGCVNDVFLMSSLLQETGFAAEDIRVVLNDRATAAGILERMEWLLEDADDGMERVFYYSGHGAQIPGYGTGEKVDRKDECLVAHDFDWTAEHAVTDDQFYNLYSQLPYDTRFCAIFDCCHSGGMTREGGARIRGLSAPDDIRHRTLRWDTAEQMWVSRDLPTTERQKKLARSRSKHASIFGQSGDEHRLFRAAALRPEDAAFDQATRAFDHHGPYLPIILQACEEKQYSYEYRHGVTSYGAFTYSLAHRVRELRSKGRKATWESLVADLAARLKRLRYDQNPCLVCPGSLRKTTVPWSLK